MAEPLRIVFAGTPEFACTVLEGLLEAGHGVAAAYTQPDRPAGRGRRRAPSPVKALAAARGLPVEQPETLGDASVVAGLRALEPEVVVVAAYGLILPVTILAVPPLGCLNVHASLLPRWRGAAPVQRALLAGDTETGVSIMRMDEGLDTGPVLAEAPCPIGSEETAGSLTTRLARLGAATLVDVLARLPGNPPVATPQEDALASHAPRIQKSEARVDWGEPAAAIERRVRALDPSPVAWTPVPGPDGPTRLRVWRARVVPSRAEVRPGTVLDAGAPGILVATGVDGLLIEEVQPPGGRRMAAADYLNARPLPRGTLLAAAGE